MNRKLTWHALIGAAFLMATSAIGPGFLTQTAVFTQQLAASFAFAILVTIIIDIIVQLNVWRIIAVTEKRAQDIANLVLPGLGYFVSFLIVLGGLVFNIGNIGGTGLGLSALFGIPPKVGALFSGIVALIIFLTKDAGKAMDRVLPILGLLMIALTFYVLMASKPPIALVLKETVFPSKIDIFVIVTLVGGTIGGYITYAGGHRLLEAGIKGQKSLPRVHRSAISGIGIAAIMRIILFLAALGVVSQGFRLDQNNPAASIFYFSMGELGLRFFGIVLWAAAISSVIGAAYTSVSFIQTFHPWLDKHHQGIVAWFIVLSTIIFVFLGNPVEILIYAGAINGIILPVTLGVMLIAVHQRRVVGDYQHPRSLTITGGLIVLLMLVMSVYTIVNLLM